MGHSCGHGERNAIHGGQTTAAPTAFTTNPGSACRTRAHPFGIGPAAHTSARTRTRLPAHSCSHSACQKQTLWSEKFFDITTNKPHKGHDHDEWPRG